MSFAWLAVGSLLPWWHHVSVCKKIKIYLKFTHLKSQRYAIHPNWAEDWSLILSWSSLMIIRFGLTKLFFFSLIFHMCIWIAPHGPISQPCDYELRTALGHLFSCSFSLTIILPSFPQLSWGCMWKHNKTRFSKFMYAFDSCFLLIWREKWRQYHNCLKLKSFHNPSPSLFFFCGLMTD